MVFGIVLHRSGWRIDYLGMDTPLAELTRTVDARRPALVVVAATLPETLGPLAAQLTALAQRAPLALAGAGATPQIASAVGARLLTGAPVTEAEILSGRGEGARGRRLPLRGQPTVPQLVTGSPSARPPWRRGSASRRPGVPSDNERGIVPAAGGP
jgi:hypothetical protein